MRRGDWFGYQLYKMRNDASHTSGADKLAWLDLKVFMTDILLYLSQHYQSVGGKHPPSRDEARQTLMRCQGTHIKRLLNILYTLAMQDANG